METLTRIPLAPFIAVRTELKVMTNKLRAHHLGLIFKQEFSEYQIRVSFKRGFLVIRKALDASAAMELDSIQRSFFAKLYAKLFTYTTETKRTTQVKPSDKPGMMEGKRGKESVTFPASEARSRSRFQRKGGAEISLDELRAMRKDVKEQYKRGLSKKGVIKYVLGAYGQIEYITKYIRIEEYGKQVHVGVVQGSLTKFFGQIYDNIGQRKGINSRLWYNAVQTSDILQDVAYKLGDLIRTNDPLIMNEGELAKYLIQCGKNLFWDSLEIPLVKEDAELDDNGKPIPVRSIHEHTESMGRAKDGKIQVHTGIVEKRYTWKRKGVPRLYNIQRGDDIIPSDTLGMGRLQYAVTE
jgi:hypothetical protein